MRQRGIGEKGLLAMICSLLLVLEPAYALPPAGAGRSPRVGDGAARIPGETSEASRAIAVAKLSGTVERNGLSLPNGSIVFSGDRLNTEQASALQLSSAPQERVWLGSNTSARLTKDAQSVVVALERGSMGFESRGHVEVNVVSRDFAMRALPGTPVLAELTLVSAQRAQLWLQRGSLEITQDGRSVVLEAGRTGIVSSTEPRSRAGDQKMEQAAGQNGPATPAGTGSINGTVVDTKGFTLGGATVTLLSAAGKTYTTESAVDGSFILSGVPAGTYTLRVSHEGFRPYETRELVVSEGKLSSIYVKLTGKATKGLIVGVIAGAGAGAGIAIALAHRGGSKTSSVSPSSTP